MRVRVRARRVVVLAGVLAVAVGLAGCGEGGGAAGGDFVAAESTTTDVPPAPQVSVSPSGSLLEGLGAGPAKPANPSRTPDRSTSRTPKPRSTPKPVARRDVPPPLKPQPVPSCTKPFYKGEPASRAEVKQALEAAAAKTYWPVSAPEIKVPVDLVKAIAWQESGWQSNIYACDGGVGLMQIMPGTLEQMNNRFGKDRKIDVYTDNADTGANYLAWLIKYLGDLTGYGYDIDPADCASVTDPCMLNAVISAYNAGPGNVLVPVGDDTVPDELDLADNEQYVRNVRALMTECVCLSY